MKNLDNTIVHFIGIGGISMSGLALFMHKSGYIVQGSDKCYSKNMQMLQKNGINVFIGHDVSNIKNAEICIYTSAIDKNNPELVYAKKHCLLIERSELLGKICKSFKNTIAISGTHGKTTTTAMIGQTLLCGNLDPTIHIGGNFDYIGGNFRFGGNKFIVTEACEYNKSFLQLQPDYLIINNIELDHLDCYKNIEEIENAFLKLVSQTKKCVIINGDIDIFQKLKTNDKNLSQFIKFISFGEKSHCAYRMVNLRNNNEKYTFDIMHNNQYFTTIKMNISGKYNALNALACAAICDTLSIPIDIIKNSLEHFCGVERRLEIVNKLSDAVIIKDYAHHPTEIKNVLHNIKGQKYEKCVVIFQPHTYSRTLGLFNEFITCFNECDSLILLPTYAARETPILGGRSEDLYTALIKHKKNVYFAKDFDTAKQIALQCISKNTCIILLGAGDIENLFN